MIKHNVINELLRWRCSKGRKPLILRGARQVGKTFTVKTFAKEQYKNFYQLNLEKIEHQNLFLKVTDAKTQLLILESYFGQKIDPSSSLIFIDEIQHSKNAIQMLRYFYEELPAIHLIAAGSLLEVLLRELEVSFPVGRVQYLYMHPTTFGEYLNTFEEKIFKELFTLEKDAKVTDQQHQIYLSKVQDYALIGGMPEPLVKFSLSKSFLDAEDSFNSLVQSYFDDINKYASGEAAKYIRHVLYSLPPYVGQEIIYKNFGGSSYGSREISNAFETLELVGLLSRVFSARSVATPIVSNYRKRPKLLHLDIGLVNFSLKQRRPFFYGLATGNMENVYKGGIAEQFVGQAFLALENRTKLQANYWYRDSVGSKAEVDFIIEYQGELVPIEVKNSNEQFLRSLYSFVDESHKNRTPCKQGIRIGSSPFRRDKATTPNGNTFELVQIPFYLVWRMKELL